MEYRLERNVLESSGSLPISQDDFLEIKTAKAGLVVAISLEEKFDLVVANYLEWETTLLEATASHMLVRDEDYEFFQFGRTLFNRRLMNLLSACRSYLDSTHAHLRAMRPDDTDAIRHIKEERSWHYDNKLGFRVMEALRNHVQHSGFPIHAVSYPSRVQEHEQRDYLEFGIIPYVKTSYLRDDGDFKKSVLDELEALGGRVSVKRLAAEYVSALSEIHELIRADCARDLEAWDQLFAITMEKYRDAYPDEKSIVGLGAVKRDGTHVVEREPVFPDIIDYRKSIVRRNGVLHRLPLRYVTSRVSEKDA